MITFGAAPVSSASATPIFTFPFAVTTGVTYLNGLGTDHGGSHTKPSSHTGQDLYRSGKNSIYAIAAGEVMESTYASAWGNYVTIDHGGGWWSRYQHLAESDPVVGPGQIAQGGYVGVQGNSGSIPGTTIGTHLHLSMANGSPMASHYVDPKPYLLAMLAPSSPGATAGVQPFHYQPVVGDFNGDGTADFGLRDSFDGTFHFRHSPGFSSASEAGHSWGADGTHYRPLAGDFTGDGVTDIALFDTYNGHFYFRFGPNYSSSSTFSWGVAGTHYQPFAADFTGNGITDIGVRDSSTGTFYIRYGPDYLTQSTVSWPAKGDHYRALAADFNGDGIAEIALWDSVGGTFYFRSGPGFATQTTHNWAAGAHYQPFAADFTGSGYADIGLRDSTTGSYYIKYGPTFATSSTQSWVKD